MSIVVWTDGRVEVTWNKHAPTWRVATAETVTPYKSREAAIRAAKRKAATEKGELKC